MRLSLAIVLLVVLADELTEASSLTGSLVPGEIFFRFSCQVATSSLLATFTFLLRVVKVAI